MDVIEISSAGQKINQSINQSINQNTSVVKRPRIFYCITVKEKSLKNGIPLGQGLIWGFFRG
jgi:hypothetical protein